MFEIYAYLCLSSKHGPTGYEVGATVKNNLALLDQCWQWLTMALVGEELDEGNVICGAVVLLSSRPIK
jgi:hypothetical protein